MIICPQCQKEIHANVAMLLKNSLCPHCHFGLDTYRAIAAVSLERPYADVTPEERRAAKSVFWDRMYL